MQRINHFKMKRRKFLAIAGLGGVVAALVSFKFITHPFESVAKGIIKGESLMKRGLTVLFRTTRN
jgi:hypothetical protein